MRMDWCRVASIDDDGSLVLTWHLPGEIGALVMMELDIAVEGLPVFKGVPAGTSA
jgi:hypothetical protein